jgi:hypothetical protein
MDTSATVATVQMLTTEDLSALLGRSADWWARKARRKEVPHLRIGSSIRFTAAHFAQIVAANEVPATSSDALTSQPTPADPPSASPMGLTPRSAAAARRRAQKAT